jgi:hypothetical protein
MHRSITISSLPVVAFIQGNVFIEKKYAIISFFFLFIENYKFILVRCSDAIMLNR